MLISTECLRDFGGHLFNCDGAPARMMIINKHIMRSTNEKQVLQQIINFGPVSRSQISRNLNLNKVTVSDIYNQLLREGLIREVGHGTSTRNGGRKPVMALLNVDYGYVISVGLRRHHFSLIKSWLDGRTEHYESVTTNALDLTAVIDLMDAHIEKVIAESATPKLLGIAFGLDGTIFENDILDATLTGLKNFSLAKYFSDRYKVPVLVENQANETALYERDFDQDYDAENLISITIRDQIHAGIITNGQLYIGHQGEAGNVGQGLLEDRRLEDHMQPANEYASEWAVLNRIKAIEHTDRVDVNRIRREYLSHDAELLAVLDEFEYYLARILSHLTTSFAPDIIFLNAPMLELLPELLTPIRQYVGKMTGSQESPIVLSKNIKEASLLGGSSAIIHKVLGLEDLQLTFDPAQQVETVME